MESIKILIKGIGTVLLMLLKYILSKLLQFLKYLKLLTQKVLKWFLLPKVRPWLIPFVFFVLISSIGAYRYYLPNINITFTEPLKSDNIFTSTFTIDNNGQVNVYDVNVAFTLYDLNYKQGSNTHRGNYIYQGNDLSNPNAQPYYKRIPSKRGQSFDVNMLDSNDFGGGHIPQNTVSYSAKLVMYLEYVYWFGQKTHEETFQFHTSELVNGKIIWLKGE